MEHGDHDLVRSYLADHGWPMDDPLQGIKDLLRTMNRGFSHSRVEAACTVSIVSMAPSQVHIPNRSHFDAVGPRKPRSPSGGVVIHGVLLPDGKRYRLVDGYHRMKWDLGHGVTVANYILLSGCAGGP